MKDITKIKIAQILPSGVFWVPIIISYFQFRGLSLETAYYLVSLYQIFIVILEYPTGVIGDYFSHKLSLTLGYVVVFAAFIMMGFELSIFIYGLVLFVAASGVSLISGSNDAVLMNISKDFDKDFRNIRTYSIAYSIISIALGGVLYKIHPVVPIWASAISFFAAFGLVIWIE
jgi:MFS family permease